jgi:hypothetical protein
LGTASGSFLFGIEISGGNNNTVGGTSAGARNVVCFNGAGIEIDNGSQNNVIQGSFSGVGADGVTPVKNLQHGIALRSGTFNNPLGPPQANEPGVSFNLIGGTVAGAGNFVEFNGTGGVAVFGNPVSASGQPNIGNAIERNSIFENGRSNSPANFLLGIDLTNQSKYPVDDGISPNDSRGHGAANDPNSFQNFPVLTSAASANKTTVTGTLKSERPGGMMAALYIFIGYGGLSLIQLLVQWGQILDHSMPAVCFGREGGVHVMFDFAALKMTAFLAAFVISLRSVRMSMPSGDGEQRAAPGHGPNFG